MGYIFCSMPGCRSGAHGSHDAGGNNLCKKCKAAYDLGVYHRDQLQQGAVYPYKLGGETWEKATQTN